MVDNSSDVQVISVDAGPANLNVKTTLFSDGIDDWALGDSGNNQVIWEYSEDGISWGEFLIANDPYLLDSNVPQSETRDLHLRLTMPTVSDSSNQYGSIITIVATSP